MDHLTRTAPGRIIPSMRLLIALICFAAVPALASDLPDPKLTPGAVLPVTAAEVCQLGYAKSVRHVDGRTKAKVYREYGIERTSGYYEIDHLISLSLGGSNDIENLWPQNYESEPWNAEVKDRLEDRLHSLVCGGAITLQEAQKALAQDWIAAYQKYIGSKK
jgi:hypothetical protein